MDTIAEDLQKRKLRIAAVICETEDGKLQLLSYGPDGLVYYISEVVDSMNVSEHLGSRTIRPMVTIGRNQPK